MPDLKLCLKGHFYYIFKHKTYQVRLGSKNITRKTSTPDNLCRDFKISTGGVGIPEFSSERLVFDDSGSTTLGSKKIYQLLKTQHNSSSQHTIYKQ